MLNGIASFFFGATEDVGTTDDGAKLQTKCTEDDWVIVDMSLVHGADTVKPSGPIPMVTSNCRHGRISPLHDRSNTPSPTKLHMLGYDVLGVPSLEESWLVTPPPCFVSGGISPHCLATSPLEDALIEHPSMSVYGPRNQRCGSAGDSVRSSASSMGTNNTGAAQVSASHPPHRPRAIAAHAGMLVKQSLKQIQRMQTRKSTRKMNRSHLERANKVSRVRSVDSKKLLRKSIVKQPSSRTANRKC